MPAYEQFGVSSEWVERVKRKLKDPAKKERVKAILNRVTVADLQNRIIVKKLIAQVSQTIGEKLTDQQMNQIVAFVIQQKIDPNNSFHLIKLWNMFR
jgi:hypothetical protein